tara:strand:+ start:390 stop:569 length:180 start_codon:yes stop_codon:yes gene_type:complete
MSKPDGIELALYACLRYEEATLRNLPKEDVQRRWDINDVEKETILKWMNNRQKDITGRL